MSPLRDTVGFINSKGYKVVLLMYKLEGIKQRWLAQGFCRHNQQRLAGTLSLLSQVCCMNAMLLLKQTGWKLSPGKTARVNFGT